MVGLVGEYFAKKGFEASFISCNEDADADADADDVDDVGDASDGNYDDDDDDDDSISGLSAIETEPEFKLLLPLAAAI